MSNQIRLKRGSGSDPSASDLVTGEIAIRTDNGKLFTKRDNGNVTEITGGGGIDDGDKGDITVSNSGGTFTIDNGVIVNAKVASNAAIAGSKISPDFGSQDIVTTGNIDLSNSTGSGNNRIKIGANDEIEIFRSGTESVIVETQGNNLDLAGNRVNLLNQGRTEVMLVAIANGGVELYHNNSKKLETDSNGVTISGRLLLGDSSGANDNRIRLGADGDLSLYHDGNNSVIDSNTGNLYITSANSILVQGANNENVIKYNANGAVELYHDNSKKFETSSSGGTLIGNLDVSSGLDVTGGITASNTGNASLVLDAGTGSQAGNQISFIDFKLDGTLKGNIAINEAVSGTPLEINSAGSGATKLYNAGSEKLSTSSSGVSVTGTCTATTFSGSGASLTNVDAATLDSIDSSQFLRSDANDTSNSQLTFSNTSGNSKINFSGIGGSGSYNYAFGIANDGGNKGVHFVNGSTRSSDGGVNTYTIRNDGGTLRLGHGSYPTKIEGTQIDVTNNLICSHSNGQVELKSDDGCIEIIRTSGGAFIDFKNSTGEDFDARISENNGGFDFTGNNTINGTLDIGGSSVSGNEGGEMRLTYAPNSSLNGSAIVFDQIINSIRFFENGSPHRGFILDFTTAGNGAATKIWHAGNDGAGSGLDADTLDGQQASAFVTTSGTTFSGDVGFSGGAGAANINANSDIRFAQGTWTGEATKIQGHNNYMYIQGGSNGIIFRRSNGTDNWFITSAGHFIPGPNNSLDLGGTSNRIRNIYTNDLNLSNEGGSNDVDGTWGSYTIQEGADDLFLINRRNGKKYKFNLTEVS